MVAHVDLLRHSHDLGHLAPLLRHADVVEQHVVPNLFRSSEAGIGALQALELTEVEVDVPEVVEQGLVGWEGLDLAPGAG